MTQRLIVLENRKRRVLSMRTAYKFGCEKETYVVAPDLSRYDHLLDQIVKAIKAEWNKIYNRKK